jgi:hypothetical protein
MGMVPGVPLIQGTAMATIFNFKAADTSTRRGDSAAQNAQCEIILFPGVRYERWADAPPPEPQKLSEPKRSRAKKRVAEMAD